jgi:pimeloyl-ACP methyl ester carboxylesterase
MAHRCVVNDTYTPLMMRRVAVRAAELESDDQGLGEPIVFIQTALTADELVALAGEEALESYRRVVYHRRGYGDSTPLNGPRTIESDAMDCLALLHALEIERAHIVGLSFSGAVALQLAALAPETVQSLVLIEPPPIHTPSSAEFRAANNRLIDVRRERGSAAALDPFLGILVGLKWRAEMQVHLPGSVAQMERDASVFFDSDLPALLNWTFGPADARRISCPVLYIGGTDSGQWFDEVRELMLDWLPQADAVPIVGADHSLALTHPAAVATALVPFLTRHPAGA